LHPVVNKILKIKNLKSEYLARTTSGKQMRKTHIKNDSSNGILLFQKQRTLFLKQYLNNNIKPGK